MIAPGFTGFSANGAPAAPAPPPTGLPAGGLDDPPPHLPYHAPGISGPVPLGQRPAGFQLATGTEFHPELH